VPRRIVERVPGSGTFIRQARSRAVHSFGLLIPDLGETEIFEHIASRDAVSRRILQVLDEARIPVVLLDRPAVPYPHPCGHDLVGIHNRRAGFVLTQHLIHLGCRRVGWGRQTPR
jgi:hypothetical protein